MDKFKILIVEDEKIEAMDIKHTLLQLGYEVPYIASKGEEAIEKAMEIKPDLVLMDIILKGDIDGIEVASKMKDLNLPVIYLTAHSEEHTLERVKETEPYGYIIKPYEVIELKNAIELSIYKNQMEKKLKESELRYKAIFEESMDAIFLYDLDGNFLDANPRALEMIGYTKEEIKDLNLISILSENHIDQALQTLNNIKNQVLLEDVSDYEILTKGNQKIYVETKTSLIRVPGKPNLIQGLSRDISKQKKDEEALKRSDSFLNDIIDQSPHPMWISDSDGSLIRINQACLDLLNISLSDVMGTYNVLEDNIVEEQGFMPLVRSVFDEGQTVSFQLHYDSSQLKHLALKDYVSVILDVTIFPIMDDQGTLTNAVIQHKDITQQRKLEEELISSNEWLSFTQKAAACGFWDRDIKGKELVWSPELYELFGLKTDMKTSIEVWIDIIHPDDRQMAMDCAQEAINAHKFLVNEYRVIKPDEEVIWIRTLGTTYYDDEDKPYRMSGICFDITEMKKSEEHKKIAEFKYRSLFENMLNGFAYCKMEFEGNKPVDFTYIDVNQAFKSLTGLENVEGKKVSEVIPGIQEIDPELFEIYGRVALTGESETFETYLKSLDEWFSVSVYSPEKEYFVAIFNVVSQRKIAEQALKDSQEKLKMGMDMAKLVYWEYDAKTDLFTFDDQFYALYGTSSSQEGGNQMSSAEYAQKFIPPEEAVLVAHEISKALETDDPNFSETIQHSIIRADGKKRYIIVRYQVVKDENGQTLGTRGVNQDITDLKMAEKALKKSIAEKDLLLREIHHRVKNNLQIIASLLHLQEINVEEEATVDLLKESEGRVKSMAMVHEKLYQSPSFTNLNIKQYIQKLLSDIVLTYHHSFDFIKTNLDIEDVNLNIDTAIPLGLIINELTTNSIKHAFSPQGNGEISLSLHRQEEGYELIISDDGRGFPGNIDFKNTETLGLQLVNSLVNQIDGDIKLEKDQGTKFIITFKELEYKKRIIEE